MYWDVTVIGPQWIRSGDPFPPGQTVVSNGVAERSLERGPAGRATRTQGRRKRDTSRDSAGGTVITPIPEVRAVRGAATMGEGGGGTTSFPPMRVMTADRRIVDQNEPMRRWAAVAADEAELTCADQLRSPMCGTDRCPVERLRSESSWIHEAETDLRLPDGDTRHALVVTEHYRNRSGDDRFLQSFGDLTALNRSVDSDGSRITIPDPTDAESFRDALRGLLQRASANDVSFENRPWECDPEEASVRWDIEIALVKREQ